MSVLGRSEAPLDEALEVDIDGLCDEGGIAYIGSARRLPNGKWWALAAVHGCLCKVEVSIHRAVR